MTDTLTRICDTKREEVAARKASATLADLAARASEQTVPRGFEAALRAKAETGFSISSRRNPRPRSTFSILPPMV